MSSDLQAVARSAIRVVIAGASGRMGQMLVDAVCADANMTLVGALDHASSPALGQDAGAFAGRTTGIVIQSDLATALAGAHVLIDFTRPEGTLAHVQPAPPAWPW